MNAHRTLYAWTIGLFVVVGGVLPALLPGRERGGLAPARSWLQTVCEVLYFLTALLPRGTSDGIKMPVGAISLGIWGFVAASSIVTVMSIIDRLRAMAAKRGP